MKVADLEFRPYIREEDINKAINQMAERINRDYRGKDPLFMVILNGAFIFAADLIRLIRIPSQVSFIKLSSYHDLSSTGKVKELIGLNENIFNRNLIILEDIIDSGLTLQHVLSELEDLGVASIEIASLFFKPESLKSKLNIKYIGFEIPNQFIVGYGLDYQGYGRNLKDIYIKK